MRTPVFTFYIIVIMGLVLTFFYYFLRYKKLIKDFKKVKEESEEAKASLKIKVKARTKELKELTESLDGQVEEKTKELQGRIDELEKFHKLTVGRELKMIELKKEIKELKKELEK